MEKTKQNRVQKIEIQGKAETRARPETNIRARTRNGSRTNARSMEGMSGASAIRTLTTKRKAVIRKETGAGVEEEMMMKGRVAEIAFISVTVITKNIIATLEETHQENEARVMEAGAEEGHQSQSKPMRCSQ